VQAIRIWLEGEPLARHHELADLLNSLPMSYSSLYDQASQPVQQANMPIPPQAPVIRPPELSEAFEIN